MVFVSTALKSGDFLWVLNDNPDVRFEKKQTNTIQNKQKTTKNNKKQQKTTKLKRNQNIN